MSDETGHSEKAIAPHLHEHRTDHSVRHAQEAPDTGTPIMRPLFVEDPSDEPAGTLRDPYPYGEDDLVAPVLEEGPTGPEVGLRPELPGEAVTLN